MANGAPGNGRPRTVKRRTRAPLVLRVAGRLSMTAVALLVFALIAIQFARVIQQNVALAGDLATTQGEITALQARREWQMREVRRLEDPEGTVPDIHDRLKLVRPNEAIIFVSPAPAAVATPAP